GIVARSGRIHRRRATAEGNLAAAPAPAEISKPAQRRHQADDRVDEAEQIHAEHDRAAVEDIAGEHRDDAILDAEIIAWLREHLAHGRRIEAIDEPREDAHATPAALRHRPLQGSFA